MPIRPNPLKGGFPFLHVGWVDKKWIVLEFLYFRPCFVTYDHLLPVASPSNKLFWLRTCSPQLTYLTVILFGVIKTRPQVRLHHPINSYRSEMKLSLKCFTICKLLKQRVFTYPPLSKCCKLFDDLFGFRDMSSVDLFLKKLYAFPSIINWLWYSESGYLVKICHGLLRFLWSSV